MSAILIAAPVTARAGGLYVPGIGPSAESRAGAFVATADDGSALATNPAGLAKGTGVRLYIGSNLMTYSLDFQRRGTYDAAPGQDLPWAGDAYAPQSDESKPPVGLGPFQALPMLVVDYGLPSVPGLHVAAGVFVPNSYPTRDIDSDYEIDDPEVPPPPSRYDIVHQEAAIVLPSIGVAYRINDKLDVGGRASWGLADIKATTYTWGTTNFEEWTGQDAKFDLKAKDNFVPAFGLGVLFRPTPNLEIGANWDSQVNVHAKGTGAATSPSGVEIGGMPVVIEPSPDEEARCAKGGVPGALKACIDIGLPMVTTVGGRYKILDATGAEKADVELNVAWERWTAVSDHHVVVDGKALGVLPLNDSYIVHNFDDVISVRLGGSYAAPVGAGLKLSGGVAYDTAAAPDGWERLDLDGAARTTAALGAAYPFGKVTVLAGLGYVYEGTRDVGTDCNTTNAMQYCEGHDNTTPVDDRYGPDPVQPLNAGTPFESPFNAGTYESSYFLLHVAAKAQF